MNEVLTLFKPESLTPLQLISIFRNKYPQYKHEKISVAGRLDPMASGIVILLIGNANKRRLDYLCLKKTYDFTLLCGVTTDTYDILGVIKKLSDKKISDDQIRLLLPQFKATFTQQYPPFSSKPVNGKPLFYWARSNKLAEIEIPTKEISITQLDLITSESIKRQELLENINRRITLLAGDFRQEEVLASWHLHQPMLPNELQSFSLSITVSSGTYIRSLCDSIGKSLGCGGIAYSIKRTSIGNYSLNNVMYI